MLVWVVIAAMAAGTLVSLAVTGLQVDLASNPALLLSLVLLAALSAFYRYARPRPRVQSMSHAAIQVLLILLFGVLMTYAAAAVDDYPYRDKLLLGLDRTLGFSRRAYLAFFSRRPQLADIVDHAYVMLLPQFALVPLALAACGRTVRMHTMLIATAIALVLTSAIAAFVPAVDAYVYIDLARAKAASLVATQVPTLEALRSGLMQTIRLDDLEGLITFPSFHTAGGLIFAWALWGLRYARWGGLALNAALIAATPVVGGHYFVDVVGGAAVAVVSIVAASAACRHARQAEALRAMDGFSVPEAATPA